MTGATLVVAAAGLASANSISYESVQTGPTTGGTWSVLLPGFNNAGGLYNLQTVTLYLSVAENITSFILTNNQGSTVTFNASVTNNITQSFTDSADSAKNNVIRNENLQIFDTGTGTGQGGCEFAGGDAPYPSIPVDNCHGAITLNPTGPGAVASYSPYSIYTSDLAYQNTNNVTDGGGSLNTATGHLGLDGMTFADANVSDYLASVLGLGTCEDVNSISHTGCFNLNGTIANSTTLTENGGGTPNVNIGTGSTVIYQAEVDYTYSINSGTPEPATMVLMGGALLGLGLFGKKRFKKN